MSKKTKIALAGGLMAVLVLGFWWNSLMAKMASSAQAQLVARANEKVNGKVTIGDVEFSIWGTLTAHSVALTDSQNVVVGRSDKMAVRFGLGDVLAGKADLSALQSVTLENPVITLAQDKDGRWNWENVLKSGKDQDVTFRGTLTVKQGTMLIKYGGSERKLEAVNGSVDFARYPALSMDLTAKSGSTPLSMAGIWMDGGDGELAIKTAQAALPDLPLALAGETSMRLTGGTARNITVTVKQKAGKLSLAGEGTVEKMTATMSGYAISEGAGKLSLADGKARLEGATMLVNGQKVAVAGELTLAEAGLILNLDLQSTAFDPGALAAMPLKGPLAFKTKLEGPATNPEAKGTFTIANGSFGAISFVNGRGSFVYTGGTLRLADTQANAWDGTLVIQGDIVPATKQYHLTANGRGVDSALLTDKDIHGRADFNARLNGQGASGGNAEGSFQMGEGSFSGIPFLAMTGDFVKQGEQMSFQNVTVRTIGGSFRAEGLSEGSIIRLRQTGGIADPRQSLEKAITDKLAPDLKKFLPGR